MANEFKVKHGLITPSVASDTEVVNFTGTGAVKVPTGTNAQRPAPALGTFRFNTEANLFEGYSAGRGWSTIISRDIPWVKITSNHTAAYGDKLIADTGLGPFTITLPANPVVGDYVTIFDGDDWSVNPLTVSGNGSTIETIQPSIVIDVKGIDFTFVYDGSTWETFSSLGPTGYTGSQGDTGFVGSQGIQGIIGYTGSQGIQGIQGVIGYTGSQGDLGYTGSQGEVGPQGPQGEQGTSINIKGTVANVIDLPSSGNVSGDAYIVSSSGDLYVWDGTQWTNVGQIVGPIGYTGSKGDTGFTGSQGIQGIQGVIGYTGSQGDQGIQGIQGFTGSQGIQGIQGIQGEQGIQGIQGELGYTGSRGYTGSQGIQGIIGYTGSQGEIGYAGSQGIVGPQGIQGFTGSQGDLGYTGSQGYTGSAGIGYTGSQGETGMGFTIAKTYASVAALLADTSPTGIVAGQFAVIDTGNVNDPENSRLYLWNGTSYQYVNDLSGAIGLTGPTGYTGSRGDSGKTIWSKHTANYTVSDQEGIIADTSGGSFTITLPAIPALGTVIIIVDGADWSVNPLTIDRNGSTIEGSADNVLLDIKGAEITFVYDGTTWQIFAAFTTAIGISEDSTTNSSFYVPFTSATTGSLVNVNVSSSKLYFNPSTGQLNATEFNSLSDVRFKENVAVLTQGTRVINSITPVEFTWKDSNKKGFGVVAQDIEKVLPEIVSTNENGIKSVSYDQLIPFLITAVKELQEEVNSLRKL